MTPPTTSRLTIAGVTHRFGSILAADAVDLEVRPGEVHCLLGPSGSGKTTLLRLVAGLDRLQSGAIEIGGREVSGPRVHRPPEARAVGFVFQDYALFPHLDARRNVAFGIDRGSRREKLRRADEWLARVGLGERTRAMPHTLSGGQQQRVALVRALAREPQVMLLDEPFSGLDRPLRAAVRRRTLDLLRATEVATLMITHDPTEALAAADRISVIRDGRILQTDAPEAIYRRATTRRVAEVFGPINRLAATARDGLVASPWGELTAAEADGAPLDGGVDLLIRADALRLPPGHDSPTPTRPRGRIVSVEVVGGLAAVRIDLGDQIIEAHDLARRDWSVGDEIEIGLAPSDVLILPAGRFDADL
ncbi:MAG: ABC transporter ATP-binding protein [Acidobacteriota bacterium]